jgi:hypothetical protein
LSSAISPMTRYSSAFNSIVVIILTFYSSCANLRIIPETTKYKQINHIIE